MDGSNSPMTLREKRAQESKRTNRVAVIVSVIIALVVFILLAALAVATTNGGTSSGLSGEGAEGANASQSAYVPPVATTDAKVEVVDSVGRTVEVPQDPVSIAVFDSFSGEFAVMIGAGDRLCGVPGGVRSDVLLEEMCPRLNVEDSDGGLVTLSGSSINIETVISKGCDVAIVKETMSDVECEKLSSASIPYVKVGYSDMAEQMDAMRVVGSVCGQQAEAKAQEFIAFYEQVIEDVATRSDGVAQADRVKVYHSINTPLLTDSKGSLGADWIEAVGCIDVSADMSPTSGTDYQTTTEQIYSWDPDMVISNSAASAQAFRQDSQWAGLRAVIDYEVHSIPIGATRWGQRGSVETYLAMLWLGCTAYPELYSDVDLQSVVTSYYKDLMGIEIDDWIWGLMLSGSLREESGNGDGTGGN